MSQKYSEFQGIVWNYYHQHSRDLPWRQPNQAGTIDPYKILVSEIMLQQTQAGRVIPKYEQFLTLFPDVMMLAQAPQQAVLMAWSGLGYNRRALFLRKAAQTIVTDYGGVVPDTEKELVALPGIGVNTARAVMAYAFNHPVAFIETNIRTVYIYHFFTNRGDVTDKETLELVEATLPKGGVGKTVDLPPYREWYWALMDYGTHLKATVGNLSRNSKHYAKQSAFSGSKRQVRGAVLKLLITGPKSHAELASTVQDDRLNTVLQELVKETLVLQNQDQFSL
jgi:A/G-specific adenine glycosylase